MHLQRMVGKLGIITRVAAGVFYRTQTEIDIVVTARVMMEGQLFHARNTLGMKSISASLKIMESNAGKKKVTDKGPRMIVSYN